MAYWVKCTDWVGGTGRPIPIYVNLDTAITIEVQSFGAQIRAAGDPSNIISVKEKPEQIFELPEVKYADRT